MHAYRSLMLVASLLGQEISQHASANVNLAAVQATLSNCELASTESIAAGGA